MNKKLFFGGCYVTLSVYNYFSDGVDLSFHVLCHCGGRHAEHHRPDYEIFHCLHIQNVLLKGFLRVDFYFSCVAFSTFSCVFCSCCCRLVVLRFLFCAFCFSSLFFSSFFLYSVRAIAFTDMTANV